VTTAGFVDDDFGAIDDVNFECAHDALDARDASAWERAAVDITDFDFNATSSVSSAVSSSDASLPSSADTACFFAVVVAFTDGVAVDFDFGFGAA
jgi:hypothetical protein